MEITERFVKSLKAPGEGNIIQYDGEIPGFGIRITSAGVRSFVLNYRIHGRERRYTIGRWPEWSVLKARKEAAAKRYEISQGNDPLAQREHDRAEPLMNELAKDYMEAYALDKKRPASLRNDRQMLDRLILPRLGKIRVSAIGPRDISLLHASLKPTPYQANRVLSLLSKMFTLAMAWKWREDNPVKGIERYHEDEKQTWLNVAQLRSLEQALAEYADQEAADAIRLLILTGSRTGEVLRAEWPHFDLERGIWTKPSHHTKQQEIEHVPLNRAALAILIDMKKRSRGANLFPGKNGARVTLRRPWMQVLKAAGLAQAYKAQGRRRELIRYRPLIRMHDLRHTFASHLVSSGESLHKVGKLLGHTSPQTTARYAHLDDGALRDTANNFGNVYRRLER